MSSFTSRPLSVPLRSRITLSIMYSYLQRSYKLVSDPYASTSAARHARDEVQELAQRLHGLRAQEVELLHQLVGRTGLDQAGRDGARL